MSARGNEKCLMGGVAAGRVACALDDLYSHRFSKFDEISRARVVSALEAASKYAKGLRNFAVSRSAAIDLEKSLKNSLKAFSKGPDTLASAQEAKDLKKSTLEAKAALIEVVRHGMGACGHLSNRAEAAADALTDHSFYLKDVEK